MAHHTPDMFNLAKAHFNKLEYSPDFWQSQLQSRTTPTIPETMLFHAMTGTFACQDMYSYLLNAKIDVSDIQSVKQHDMILYAVAHLYPQYFNKDLVITIMGLLDYQLFNTAYYLLCKDPQPDFAKLLFKHILVNTEPPYINTIGVGRLLVLLGNVIAQRDGGETWAHMKIAQANWMLQFNFVVLAQMGRLSFDHHFIDPDVGIDVKFV